MSRREVTVPGAAGPPPPSREETGCRGPRYGPPPADRLGRRGRSLCSRAAMVHADRPHPPPGTMRLCNKAALEFFRFEPREVFYSPPVMVLIRHCSLTQQSDQTIGSTIPTLGIPATRILQLSCWPVSRCERTIPMKTAPPTRQTAETGPISGCWQAAAGPQVKDVGSHPAGWQRGADDFDGDGVSEIRLLIR